MEALAGVAARGRMSSAAPASRGSARLSRSSPPSSGLSSWWVVAAVAALPLAGAGLSRDGFASFVLAAASVQGLFAVSWVLLGASGQPSLGQALPYGAGAYAAALVARHIPLDSNSVSAVTPAVLTAAGVLAGASAGAFLGRLTRRLNPVFLAAVTLAAVEAAHSLATMWTAPVIRGISEGDTTIPIGPFPSGDRAAMWVGAGAMAAGVFCVALVMRSRAGTALRAAAGDDRESLALGFNAPRLRVAAFVLSGALAGAAGALAAQFAGRVSPDLVSWRGSLFAAAAALVGGPCTIAGPAAAGYVIAALAQAGEVPAEAQLLLFAAVLAAASVRDPRHVLGLSFGWTRPAEDHNTPHTRTQTTSPPRLRAAGD
jgi:branched-chain amino acid transport system permease protein